MATFLQKAFSTTQDQTVPHSNYLSPQSFQNQRNLAKNPVIVAFRLRLCSQIPRSPPQKSSTQILYILFVFSRVFCIEFVKIKNFQWHW